MEKLRTIWILPVAIIAGLIGVLLYASFQAHREKQQAERFLTVLRNIQVNSTDSAAMVRLMQPFGSHVHESTDRTVNEFDFHFDNIWLARFKLAPYSDFDGWITLDDGIVVRKTARLSSNQAEFVVRVLEEKRGLGCPDGIAPSERPNHIVRGLDQQSGSKTTRIWIENDDTYEPANRRKEWGFNLSCLTRIGGCWDARLMLPSAAPPSNPPTE